MTDYIVRGTAADNQIRVFAATTKSIVEEGRRIHSTSPTATAALGRLLTAGAIMGGMQKNSTDILTLQIAGSGPIGGMTVTAGFHTDVKQTPGKVEMKEKVYVKGYAKHPEADLPLNSKGKLDVGGLVGAGYLSVIKDMGLKDPFVGQVNLVSGEVAEDITSYYANSEQIPSSVALGVLVGKGGEVKCAGGFVIQLMPFASEEVIDKLEARLSAVRSVTSMLDSGMSPEAILEEVFEGMGLELTDKIEADYYCNCSKERVSKAVQSVSLNDLREMANDGKPIEVGCFFCGRKYEFSTEDIKNIIKAKKTN